MMTVYAKSLSLSFVSFTVASGMLGNLPESSKRKLGCAMLLGQAIRMGLAIFYGDRGLYAQTVFKGMIIVLSYYCSDQLC